MQTPTFAFVAQLARRAGFALLPVIVASASLTLAATAEAQQAYVSARTNLRAGPDRGYPAVAWLGTGTSVYVHGCVRGYYWCDVSSGSVRGWANARHLQYYYQSRRVPIYGVGARYGFPVVGYAASSYWDSYYRDRPWYGDRHRWDGWRPGYAPPAYAAPAPRPHYVAPQPRVYNNPPPVHVAPQPRPHYNSPSYVAPPQYRERQRVTEQAPRQPQQHQQRAMPPAHQPGNSFRP